MRTIPDLIGTFHGHLEVVKWDNYSGLGPRKYICHCHNCGKDVELEPWLITRKNRRSCGCLQGTDRQFDAQKWKDYRGNAKSRDPICHFNLSRVEFRKLLSDKCYYCGQDNANGIDKIDPTGHYELSNCVSSCTQCNKGKWDSSQEEFIQMCNRVAKLHPR